MTDVIMGDLFRRKENTHENRKAEATHLSL
jgi:hypothetical protein